jgi:hypothetical protein
MLSLLSTLPLGLDDEDREEGGDAARTGEAPPAPAAPGTATTPAAAAETVRDAGMRGAFQDPAWAEVLALLDPDEPGLAELARALAGQGVRVPSVGLELNTDGWQAEMAWPSARAGVIRAGDGSTAERDAAAAQGWKLRDASDWTAAELVDRIGEGDM